MKNFKKGLALLLILSMITGCSAKLSANIFAPAIHKNNTISEDDKHEQEDNLKLEKKKNQSENSLDAKGDNNTVVSQQNNSTTSGTRSASLPKTDNSPKKIIAEAPKTNVPPAKPQVSSNVQKIQIPALPAQSGTSNVSTSTNVNTQNTTQNTSNYLSGNQNLPGLPPLNYTVSSYSEYYNAVLASLKNFDDSIYIKINNYDDKVFNLSVLDDLLIDNYDADYGLKSVNAVLYSSGSINVLNIKFSYSFTKDKLLAMRNASNSKATQVLSSIIKPGMSDFQKEKAIHDYVVTHTAYDYRNYLNGTLPGEDFSDYGVLINGSAVCEGYSKAMLKLMRMAGLEAKSVVGYGLDGTDKIPHAWNMVKINGNYTLVDTTWDDPVPDEGNNVYYNYFDISSADMAKDHQWDTSKYPQAVAVQINISQ